MTKDVRLSRNRPLSGANRAAHSSLNYDVRLLPKLLQFVRKHQLIRAGDRIGVAVSGGADSVALLRALVDVRSQLGCILSVVHLHHSLRGTEADADLAFVQQLAADHSLEFHSQRRDVAALASNEKLSIEAAGRRARIEFFAELQSRGTLDKVATAHTANDQAETVLLKFLRGAGTRGLAAIYPHSQQAGATIIRPLLDNTRADVEQYLRGSQQSWREDATNQSPEFLRNRVRHDLLPLLQREFNPALVDALNNTAEIAREEQQFWDTIVGSALHELLTGSTPKPAYDSARFQSMHIALQCRVLMALTPMSLDFDHIERTREFILAGHAGEREIARGVRIQLVRDAAGHHSFSFATEASVETEYSVSLTLPGEAALPPPRSSRIVARLAESPRHGMALDASLTGRTLTIRNWRAGDRYQPLGRGHGKLKDFFQQLHIPASERTSWPVAELNGEIVWVLGLPAAAHYASQVSTGLILEEVTPIGAVTEEGTSQESARVRK